MFFLTKNYKKASVCVFIRLNRVKDVEKSGETSTFSTVQVFKPTKTTSKIKETTRGTIETTRGTTEHESKKDDILIADKHQFKTKELTTKYCCSSLAARELIYFEK